MTVTSGGEGDNICMDESGRLALLLMTLVVQIDRLDGRLNEAASECMQSWHYCPFF